MTVDLLDRLAREAIDETRNAAAAEGYFSAEDRRQDRSQRGPGRGDAEGGPRRRDAHRVRAHRRDRPRGDRRAARHRRDRQAHARLEPARRRGRSGNPRGRSPRSARSPRSPAALTRPPASRAAKPLIDPERRSADLVVELASGPAFRFGRFEITGLAKYDAVAGAQFQHDRSRASRTATRRLNQYVRRLNASGYFASVQAKIDPDTTHPEDATVDIAVIEAPHEAVRGRRRLFDRRAVPRQRELPRRELRRQRAPVPGRRRGSKPRSSRGRCASRARRTTPAGSRRIRRRLERTDIEGLVTRTAAAGTRWHTIEERDEHALSATYYLDEQQPVGSPQPDARTPSTRNTSGTGAASTISSRPTTGWMASVFAGGGIPGVSTRTLRPRCAAASRAWLPLGRDERAQSPRRRRRGARRQPRRHSVDAAVPHRRRHDGARLRFREPRRARRAAPIVPGRYYARGQRRRHPLDRRVRGASPRSSTRATPSTRCPDAHLALGYGVGARVRTPLGPFRLDVAYGQDVHKVRVHFSVGLTF